jgi:hypothetical protein
MTPTFGALPQILLRGLSDLRPDTQVCFGYVWARFGDYLRQKHPAAHFYVLEWEERRDLDIEATRARAESEIESLAYSTPGTSTGAESEGVA